jgi:hypothetical protein
MIALEHLVAGFGSTAVAERLHEAQAQAHRDLLRAPRHLELYSRTLDAWAEHATGPDRALLDRAGPALAVAQFARPIPPTSTTGIPADLYPALLADLRTHGWLRPATPVGDLGRPWCAAIGAPFGVIAR